MNDSGAYGRLAEVYDTLNAELDYVAWADFVEAAFERYIGRRPEIVLDLACGTGRMTYELAARGYDMIGVDGSAEMLGEAMERRVSINNPLYLMQDMRDFELYGSVGAVLCCLDSINYLTEESDVLACFAAVRNYLDPGGLFLFDVSTPYRFEHIFADNAYVLEDEEKGIYCGWQNSFDAESGLCEFLLSVFERNDDNSYDRFDETQCERLYTLDKLRELLAASGLEYIDCLGGFDFAAPADNADRWYIAARRPAE
ncbi:MAG: methyltransferase domain-containing protein [Clostridia bacterium]|nr:methyltransferase domain-containing protein [Clostridia bacterium]